MGWFPLPYFIFFLLLLLHFPSNTCSLLCNHHDSSALLKFKNSFLVKSIPIVYTTDGVEHYNFGNWGFGDQSPCSSFSSKTVTWRNGTDCCQWDGVTCNTISGHVIGLDLNYEQLEGEFHPNSTIFQLRHLQKLNLTCNRFYMPSPLSYSGIGDLLKLTHLNLSYSGISGDIPSTISHLSKLESLDLSNNVVRLDPSTWNKLILNTTNLRELHLDYVNMSSIKVSSLMNLSSSLVSLHLRETSLQGKVTSDILCLPNLQELDLSRNSQLTAQLPKSNWSTPLRYLDLSFINFSGGIPNSIGHLKSLTKLDLWNCKLNGQVPLSLWNLTQLTVLDLSSNYLDGEIPSLLSNLKHLTSFNLAYNNFSGHIPEEVFKLIKLESLNLSRNSLTGPIPNKVPTSVGEFSASSLKVLHLSNNKLQGKFPDSIFEFENLTFLDLSSNNLSGVLDFHKFSKLQSLYYLDLSQSQSSFLSINFDSSVDYVLPNLESLFLSSCNIKGSFPKFLASLQNMRELDLSNNKIHGKIPKWFHDKLLHTWTDITHIDLSFNKLQGDLPILPDGIWYFLVSNNYFTGDIASTICNARSLGVLNLAHNNLTGTIQTCLETFPSLWVLDLQMNNLHGSIPEIFFEENVFETIKLNGNRLQGPLPQSLSRCRNLEVLDLGDNDIEDTLPSWLETLPELQVLSLRSNRLHGVITCSSTNHSFPKLRIFDVSENNFSGPLPASCFMNFKGMMNVSDDRTRSPYMKEKNYYNDSVVVIMKGKKIKLERILTAFTTIDLSNNMFEGGMPKVIGRLKSLKGLNLSQNGINGTLPHSLSNLSNLEWLDLSWNQLKGEIPMALTNLNFLSTLNLSQNHLQGIIPTGGQFNTFGNDSYEGNPMLCGFPLSKSCNEDELTHSTYEDDEETGFRFGWKPVAVGYACGAVVGILLGFKLFMTGKPRWLAARVEGLFGIRVKRTNNRARANR